MAILRLRVILFGATMAGLALSAAALLLVRLPVRPGVSRTMQAALSAAQRTACSGRQIVAGSYQVVLQQEYPGTVIVLYAAHCSAAGQPRMAVQGYVARAADIGPDRASCGGGSAYDLNPGIVPTGGLVTVTTGFCPYASSGQLGGFSLVWGEVTSAVGAVDVTFADRRVIRAALSGRYFAAVVPQPVEACVLHLLDRRPSLLSEHDLRQRSPVSLPTGGTNCP